MTPRMSQPGNPYKQTGIPGRGGLQLQAGYGRLIRRPGTWIGQVSRPGPQAVMPGVAKSLTMLRQTRLSGWQLPAVATRIVVQGASARYERLWWRILSPGVGVTKSSIGEKVMSREYCRPCPQTNPKPKSQSC
jgi:hypothetical protein